ncbi:MAG: DUF6279 family lipoprotein [Thermodesulfobacteriota bacterium]
MKKITIPVLLAALTISACTFKLIYNHLDWIIPWYVSDYINLNDEQDGFLGQQIAQRLKWHRVTQLTLYARTVRDFRCAAEKGLTRENLDDMHDILRLYWQDLVTQITPDVVELLSSATEDQLAELLANLERKNREFKEKYIDPEPETLRRLKVERMERFLEYFLGSLDERQDAIIADWSARLAPIGEERLVYIKQNFARFKEMLAFRNDKNRFREQLRDLLFFNREDWPPEFRIKAEHNRELTKTVFLELDQTLNADQRSHFIRKLESVGGILDELAAQAVP